MPQCFPKWKLTFSDRGKYDHSMNLLNYSPENEGSFCGTVQDTGKTASEILQTALLTKFRMDEFQLSQHRKGL